MVTRERYVENTEHRNIWIFSNNTVVLIVGVARNPETLKIVKGRCFVELPQIVKVS